MIALFIQAVILVIYRLELSSLGLEVYYSDSMVYWNATLGLLERREGNYLEYGVCVLLIPNSVNITDCMGGVHKYHIQHHASQPYNSYPRQYHVDNGIAKKCKTFVTICLSNPLVVYSLLRNLKMPYSCFMSVSLFSVLSG